MIKYGPASTVPACWLLNLRAETRMFYMNSVLAHALQKPVVLVSSNEQDVPFDVRHVRVIYYDVTDPFWGDKLIDKVAENIVSALKNPKEAVLFAD